MSTGHVAARRSWRPWVVFGLIAGLVVIVDQLTKAWVETSFELASSGAPPGLPGCSHPGHR